MWEVKRKIERQRGNYSSSVLLLSAVTYMKKKTDWKHKQEKRKSQERRRGGEEERRRGGEEERRRGAAWMVVWSPDLRRRQPNKQPILWMDGRRRERGRVMERSEDVGLTERFVFVASRGKMEERWEGSGFRRERWWSSGIGVSSTSLDFHTWKLLVESEHAHGATRW